jgi:hypothetical protein
MLGELIGNEILVSSTGDDNLVRIVSMSTLALSQMEKELKTRHKEELDTLSGKVIKKATTLSYR